MSKWEKSTCYTGKHSYHKYLVWAILEKHEWGHKCSYCDEYQELPLPKLHYPEHRDWNSWRIISWWTTKHRWYLRWVYPLKRMDKSKSIPSLNRKLFK